MLADVGGRGAADRRPVAKELRALAALRSAGEDEMGAVLGANDPGQARQVVADESDLSGGREVEVDRAEQVGECLRVPAGRYGEEPEDGLGLLLVAVLARQSVVAMWVWLLLVGRRIDRDRAAWESSDCRASAGQRSDAADPPAREHVDG